MDIIHLKRMMRKWWMIPHPDHQLIPVSSISAVTASS
jgi:hypothetical protein